MVYKVTDKKRSIGIASKELALDTHVLRFWEKEFPQIKPDIGKGGRRYYFNKDVDNIKKIKYFLYDEGYTIKGLQNLLSNNKNLLKKDLDTIKSMSKIINTPDINKDKITENINNLIEVQSKLKILLKKIEDFEI